MLVERDMIDIFITSIVAIIFLTIFALLPLEVIDDFSVIIEGSMAEYGYVTAANMQLNDRGNVYGDVDIMEVSNIQDYDEDERVRLCEADEIEAINLGGDSYNTRTVSFDAPDSAVDSPKEDFEVITEVETGLGLDPVPVETSRDRNLDCHPGRGDSIYSSLPGYSFEYLNSGEKDFYRIYSSFEEYSDNYE